MFKRSLIVFVTFAVSVLGLSTIAAPPSVGLAPARSALDQLWRATAPATPDLQVPKVGAEVVGLRTARSRTIRTATGYRTELSAGPINYQDQSGAWQPIDPTLVDGANGTVQNKAAGFDLSLPAHLSEAVTVSQGEKSLGFALSSAEGAASIPNAPATPADTLSPSASAQSEPTTTTSGTTSDGASPTPTSTTASTTDPSPTTSPVSKAPAPADAALLENATRTVAGNTATYRVDGDLSLAYESLATGVKESIVLGSPSAPRSFTFGIQAQGVTLQPGPSGVLLAVGADGKPVFTVEAASMVDAAGASTPVAVSLENGSLVMDATADGWLDAPERAWPVVIDPSTSITGTVDCAIASNVATANCGGTTLPVGSASSGSVKSRAVIDFTDLQYEVRRTGVITSATLSLTSTSVGNGSTTAVDVHPLTEGWVSGVTWTTTDGSGSWTSAGGTYDSSKKASVANAAVSGTLDFDVTDMVNDWVKFNTDQYGFVVRANAETGGNTVSFGASEGTSGPVLDVEWRTQTGRPSWVTPLYTYSISDMADLSVSPDSNLSVHVKDGQVSSTGVNSSLDHWFNSGAHYIYTTSGYGWMTAGSYGPRLVDTGGGRYTLTTGDRGIYVFKDAGSGTYTSPPGIDADLVRTGTSPLAFTLKFHQSGITWYINADGEITKIQDRNGNHNDVSYTGPAMRDGSSKVDSLTDSRGRSHDFSINGDGYLDSFEIESTAPRDVNYTYDGDLLTGIEDADGNTMTFGYDDQANLTSIIDGRGQEIDITYENPYDGKVESIIHRTANHSDPTWASVNGQDWTNTGGTMLASNVWEDANGHDTENFYDTGLRTTKVTDALSHTQANTYTSNNNVATYTDGLTAVRTVNYNGNNMPSGTQAPSSNGTNTAATTYLNYGSTGDARYHTTSSVDQQGKCQAFGYDANFNVTDAYTNQVGTGSPLACATGSGNHASASYNANGTVATSTDPNSNATSYTYSTSSGHAGELTAIDNPSPLGDEAFTYGVSSRVATHTDGKSQVTGYTYDNDDRITRITYNGDSSCTSRTTCTDFAYDANGNLTSRVDNTGTTTFTYDELNRPITKTLPSNANACSAGGTAMTFGYDGVGNLTSHCDAGGTTTYTYNDVNLVIAMAEPGGSCTGTVSKCTTFGYDDANRRTTTTFLTSPVVTQTATYDNAGNLKELKAVTSTPTTLTDSRYTYVNPSSSTTDRALRYSQTDTAGVTTNYTYDNKDRLTGADLPGTTNDQTYTWDAANNRTQKVVGSTTTNYTYNAALELTSGATTPAYDNNGSETTGPNGRTATYTTKNQAASITPSGGSALNMTYADVDSTERTAAGSTTFNASVLGLDRSVLSGTSTYYVHDPLGNLIGENIGGTRYYYLPDGLGSVLKVIDTTATVKNTYSYDPWGITTKTETVTNPWQYTGGYTDSSGLTKMGTRYYDPSIGRFTQRDPIASNQPYTYAAGNPCTYTDPTGRDCNSSTLGAIVAGFVTGVVVGAVTGVAALFTGLLTAATEGTIEYVSCNFDGFLNFLGLGFLTG